MYPHMHPTASSILRSWLYFAFLSLLAGAPVLISSAPIATEISGAYGLDILSVFLAFAFLVRDFLKTVFI
ncbi:MAG: hypothetical protein WA144_16055 [Candidatus Methanoperedens sp.]